MAPSKPKPKLAVFKFASCDGCQLSLLDCEDELLAIAKGSEKIAGYLDGKELVKEIVVPGKLVNLVVR